MNRKYWMLNIEVWILIVDLSRHKIFLLITDDFYLDFMISKAVFSDEIHGSTDGPPGRLVVVEKIAAKQNKIDLKIRSNSVQIEKSQ
jgi:hypothetical protein